MLRSWCCHEILVTMRSASKGHNSFLCMCYKALDEEGVNMTFYHSNNAITMYLKPQNIGYVLLYIYQMVLVSMLPSWTPSQITAYCPLGTWIIIFTISFNNYFAVAVLIWNWSHFCIFHSNCFYKENIFFLFQDLLHNHLNFTLPISISDDILEKKD